MYAWLIRANVSESERNQSEIKHTLRHSYDPQYTLAGYTRVAVDVECCLDAFVTCSLRQFRAQICHKPWRAKSLRLAAAYTPYGAADKILRRLTAYEVYGGLRRLMAAARGSTSEGGRAGARPPKYVLECVRRKLRTSFLGWQ